MNRAGKGFLQPDDSAIKEIAIPENATLTALHEDHVLVRRDRPESKNTGTVIRVLKRRRTKIVGTFQKSSRFLYVVPDDPRMPHDIYVPEPRDVGRPPKSATRWWWNCANGNPAMPIPKAKSSKCWARRTRKAWTCSPCCANTTCRCISPKRSWPRPGPFGTLVAPHEIAGREDCRDHPVVTIDPDDAKDFDDAICLQARPPANGSCGCTSPTCPITSNPARRWTRRRAKRGNSTYLVDRVIPMLPEALSNELCSLKPDVDRLTKCVEFLRVAGWPRAAARNFIRP